MNSENITPEVNDNKTNSHKKFFIKTIVTVLSIILIGIIGYFIYSPIETTVKYIKAENYDKAIRITNIGAAIYPFSPKWYALRGYAKFYKKDYSGAIKDFDRAYKLETDEYKMMNFDNKIYIRYFLGDYNRAIDDFDKEIAYAETNYDKDSFLWDKAQFLYNIEKYEEALKIYNQLLINANSDIVYLIQNRLYYERAQVYKKLGQDDLSSQDLENAKNLNLEASFENPIPEPVFLLDELY